MGILKNTSAYLAGPVEHSGDARSWREELAEFLTALDVKVYDPMKPPEWALFKGASPGDVYKAYIGQKSSMTRKEAFAIQENVREVCKRWAYACDWLICYLPKVFTSGTFDELGICERTGKPIFLWTPDQISTTWSANQVCKTEEEIDEYIFLEKQALLDHIKAIDDGKVPLDPLKWIFLS